jgi:hypothetical protein
MRVSLRASCTFVPERLTSRSQWYAHRPPLRRIVHYWGVLSREAATRQRNAYLSAIHKAIGALSEVRIVLSQATNRLGDPK